MKIDKRLTRKIAESANIINSLSGGTVFPTFNTTKETDHLRLEINIPSVSPERLKVMVNEDDLMIFQSMTANGYTPPNILGSMKLPSVVERDHIHAAFEEDLLVIILPINEELGGFHKEIEIDQH